MPPRFRDPLNNLMDILKSTQSKRAVFCSMHLFSVVAGAALVSPVFAETSIGFKEFSLGMPYPAAIAIGQMKCEVAKIHPSGRPRAKSPAIRRLYQRIDTLTAHSHGEVECWRTRDTFHGMPARVGLVFFSKRLHRIDVIFEGSARSVSTSDGAYRSAAMNGVVASFHDRYGQPRVRAELDCSAAWGICGPRRAPTKVTRTWKVSGHHILLETVSSMPAHTLVFRSAEHDTMSLKYSNAADELRLKVQELENPGSTKQSRDQIHFIEN